MPHILRGGCAESRFVLEKAGQSDVTSTAPALTINRIGGAIMADASNNDSIGVWKPVVGWEDLYEVSEYGRVRNRSGYVLNRRISIYGYDCPGLSRHSTQKYYMAHRLVAAAFIGPCPEGKEVNHIDGNRLNNHVSNLEYVTRRENILHQRTLGTDPTGERNPNSKLTAPEVLEIRRLRKEGVPRRVLSDRFGVTIYMISKITNRENWKHV